MKKIINPWRCIVMIYAIVLFSIIMMLCSCRTAHTATTEAVHEHTADTMAVSRESVTDHTARVTDSVIIERIVVVRDSTVDRTDSTGTRTIERWHYTTDNKAVNRLQRIIDSLRTATADTVAAIHVEKRDSVATRTERVEVARMSAAQKVFFWLGLASAILLVLFLAYKMRR